MSGRKTPQDFQFGSRLGEGSYSQVFKGVDISTRKVFAIKVLSKKHIVKEKKIKYVNIEKITLNRLGRHPGIVTLYYTFQDDNSLYFVIDLAEHGELLTLIRKLGSLSESCSRYYMIQLIDAVDFMHKKGVIHRDLKPENILLNSDMKLMITDFGAAKILELDESGNLTDHDEAFAKGSFVGTAEYVSPELLKHNKCGFESDIWAIGCILYQFIVGVPPFKGKTEYATFEKIVHLQYQWPDFFIPELIKDIVSKLLLLNPQERLSIQQLQQHPWFSRLNWDDKTKIWSIPPPKIDQYRPIVEQQLHNTTQGINRIMIQKKLPAATVKKQLLNNTINQIRNDTGANYLYNGASDGRKPVSSPQLTPPIKKPNGSPTSNPSISPIRPRLPQVQPHQRSPIPQQQQQHQFNPRVNQQHSPLSQQKPSIPGPQRPIGQIGQSPTTRNVKVATNIPPQQVQQSPTRLREAVVMSQSQQAPSAPIKKTTTVTTDAPVVPPKTFVTTRSTSTPSVKTKATPVVPVKKATTAPAPTKTITPQTTSKNNSKPPQISLPPKPKSQPSQSQPSQPPRPQQPTVVTKTNNMTPTTSPKKTYSSNFKTLDSNGVITGPTQVLNRLAKDEGIVKLDFINLSSLDLSSLRTFDPTSRLSQLGKSGGLDDVLIHEIISKNEKSLEQDMKRVVLVITDLGNLLLFDCVKIQELRFNMAIDLTDKLFAMYDYEFSEFDQSGYLILEVLKMEKLVFLSPLERSVKRELMNVATIQQGVDMSWIDALMKTKELLKSRKSSKSSPQSSSSSPPTGSISDGSTRQTTPTMSTSTRTFKRASNSSVTTKSNGNKLIVKRNTSTNGIKPKTVEQRQQQNKKFAGGAAAAAFKSVR